MELKDGFKTSESNQGEIRILCEDLGKKIDDLAGRTAALEEEVGDLRAALEENKEQIRGLKSGEAGVLAKLESLENNQRRNNLRFLRVPEGLEGDDLKGFVVKLINQEIKFEDAGIDIAKDIQRVHRVPSKMPPNRDSPYAMLYPAKLRITTDGKAHAFIDAKLALKFAKNVAHREIRPGRREC
ncbi:hypothetical protein NDU88_004661 [Pleurodeles waltl]|uniref:L1 transposable element RRM domain-containing protein n=1 Tax=Pleurodeles waltl TaxID=8319 RepID=A0AAV7NUD6_PLEWA|nr:hypothetical protein NDU88_004661 [Pleurodeles waltl]